MNAQAESDSEYVESGIVPSGAEGTAADAVDCCICQDQVDARTQGHLAHCTHQFHFECIMAWARVTNLCPLCKTKFNVVTQKDAQGIDVHRQVITDTKQVYRPDPMDDDLAAQLRLVHEARCELCGSGDDEHVLLLCDAVGCGVANHTYCIGLRAVPTTSWYCSRHASTQQRASDAIERPATTVTTRRRTRRLASLMSNVLRERSGSVLVRPRPRAVSGFDEAEEEDEDRRRMGGIAAAYAVRMSRELMQVQQRADAMFARGDLTQSSLHEHIDSSASSVARYGTRSTVASSGPSTIDRMWDENSRSRQEVAAAAIAARDHGLFGTSGGSMRLGQRSDQVSDSFAPEYCALAKLMESAVSSDNYASSVALLIPRTAKLGLVSRVKTFFGRLNQKEKAAAVELGCMSVLHQWIRVPVRNDDTSVPYFNPQVLDAVLAILEILPVRREDLVEEEGLQETMDRLSELSDVSIETRQRIIELGNRWRELNPPVSRASPRPQARQLASSPVHATHELPVITSFTSRRQPVPPNGKRKRDAWSDTVVQYVKAKLYPLYKQNEGAGNLTRERFKAIVKDVACLFSQEASSMQSAVLLPTGELSNLAKSRVRKLIDRVYKESVGRASTDHSTASTPLLTTVPGLAPTYSAVPSIKHQRRI